MATTIPYEQITGFRNLVVHEYLRVDLAFVWAVVVNDLPTLRESVEGLQRQIPQSSQAE